MYIFVILTTITKLLSLESGQYGLPNNVWEHLFPPQRGQWGVLLNFWAFANLIQMQKMASHHLSIILVEGYLSTRLSFQMFNSHLYFLYLFWGKLVCPFSSKFLAVPYQSDRLFLGYELQTFFSLYISISNFNIWTIYVHISFIYI